MTGLKITVDQNGSRCLVTHNGENIDGVTRVVIPEITPASLRDGLKVMVEVYPESVEVEASDEVKCTCSYEDSAGMTRHAPLCAVVKAGLGW